MAGDRHFPVLLDMSGWDCVVVGGGRVAGDRAVRLADAGARVRVIAPRLGDTAADAVAAGRVRHEPRQYRDGDLEGSRLAVVATDDADVNAAAAREAQRRGVLCNAAADARAGDVIVPAVVRRGDLTVAISTGGASPTVTAVVRRRIEGTFGPEWEDMLAIFARLRDDLRVRHPDPADRAARVQAVLESDVAQMLVRGRTEDAERRARSLMELGD